MGDKRTILLALKEGEEIESFREFFNEKGYHVLYTQDGAKTMELALNEPPSFIIIDLDLPIINGERVFQILKNNPNTVEVPFLFISDKEANVKGFRINTDIFITRPFNMIEMYARLKQILILRDMTSSTTDSKHIEGKLSQMSLVDLLQVLHLNRREGELRVVGGDSVGTIYLKAGEIYNAVLGDAEKEKALFRMLSWTEGTFSFQSQQVQISPKMQTSTGNLLMEGMRHIDEFEAGKASFPNPAATIKPNYDPSTLPKGLRPIIYEIFFLSDFYQKIEDLVNHCSFPDYDVYKTLQSLINRGILEVEKDNVVVDTASDVLISPTDAVKIKDKVVSRWGDMLQVDFGKVFVLASSLKVARDFILACKIIPGLSINHRLASSTNNDEFVLGEIGSLKLYGDMNVILYYVPTDESMKPLRRAFSSNLMGLMIVFDELDSDMLPDLVSTKKELLSVRHVPSIHICKVKGSSYAKRLESYKESMGLKQDEDIFPLEDSKSDLVFQVFKTLFKQLIKGDYISTGAVAI